MSCSNITAAWKRPVLGGTRPEAVRPPLSDLGVDSLGVRSRRHAGRSPGHTRPFDTSILVLMPQTHLMAIAKTWANLQAMSDDSLVMHYDSVAERTETSLTYYREEIMRRALERSAAAAQRLAEAALQEARASRRLAIANMVVAVAAIIVAVVAIIVPLAPT